MDNSFWLNYIISPILGGIGGVSFCLYKIGIYKKTIDEIEKNVNINTESISKTNIEIATLKTYEYRILTIEGYFNKIIEKKMTKDE